MSKIPIRHLIQKVEKNIEDKKKQGEDVSALEARVLPYLTMLEIKNSLSELKTVLNLKGGLSIDYEFISIDKTKNQLIKDNQRMESIYCDDNLKEEDRFITFCHYAFLQIEELVNYFLIKRHHEDGKLKEEKLIEFFQKNNSAAKLRDYKNYHSVTISKKIYALNIHFQLSDTDLNNINAIRTIRNEFSHRSSSIPNTQTESRETKEDYLKPIAEKLKSDKDYTLIRSEIERLLEMIKTDLGPLI